VGHEGTPAEAPAGVAVVVVQQVVHVVAHVTQRRFAEPFRVGHGAAVVPLVVGGHHGGRRASFFAAPPVSAPAAAVARPTDGEVPLHHQPQPLLLQACFGRALRECVMVGVVVASAGGAAAAFSAAVFIEFIVRVTATAVGRSSPTRGGAERAPYAVGSKVAVCSAVAVVAGEVACGVVGGSSGSARGFRLLGGRLWAVAATSAVGCGGPQEVVLEHTQFCSQALRRQK